MGRPSMFWLMFTLIGVGNNFGLLAYNRFILKKGALQ
jgi:hypothetical protein